MYRIEIDRRAVKELSRIDKSERLRILDRIKELAENPRPAGCRKLRQREGWRIRAGNYRIIYTIEEQRVVVVIVKIGHRKEVYR